MPRAVWSSIWRRQGTGIDDLLFALIAGLLTVALMVFIGRALTGLVDLIFHPAELPDQVAIKLMKSSFDQPLLFLINGISIALFAPIIEEILFRGFLQNYLRRFCSTRWEILGASAV